MLCEFQVYSKVNQLYRYLYSLFLRFFFSHIDNYGVLGRVPSQWLSELLMGDKHYCYLSKEWANIFCRGSSRTYFNSLLQLLNSANVA